MNRSPVATWPDGTIDSLLRSSAKRHGHRRALVSGETELSYRELRARVDRLAERIVGAASGGDAAMRGSPVAVIAPNVPAVVVALFACWRLGAVAVPLNARLREQELSGILADCEPEVVVSVPSYLGYSFPALLARLAPRLPGLKARLVVDGTGEVEEVTRGASGPADARTLDPAIAALLYTSGSTGAPKGALSPHVREVEGASGLADALGLTEEDVSIFIVPVTHAFGLTCLLATLATGGTAVLVDSTFAPGAVLTAIERTGATVLHGSPTLFASLRKARPGGLPPTVRAGFVAGALPPPQLLREIGASGFRILNLYGLTEAGAVACSRLDDSEDVRAAAAARLLPGVELRVVEREEPVPGVGGGEVQLRGPHVTPGYYRRPEETARSFQDGWFRTGDLGTYTSGRLRIHGRAKDIVHVSGFNVFPAEVEAALLGHPDVAQACVVGVPDERSGEALRGFVVLCPGSTATRADLLQFARGRIAGYKLPYELTILPKLPLLSSGKPDRLALREASQARRADPSEPSPETAGR